MGVFTVLKIYYQDLQQYETEYTFGFKVDGENK